MRNPILFWLIVSGLMAQCQSPRSAENLDSNQTTSASRLPDTLSPSQQIIRSAIAAHGGEQYKQISLSFDFRDKTYQLRRQDGKFEYTRIFKDSSGATIRDVLHNEGFSRFMNEKQVEVPGEKARAYSNSINSVAYFALLPFNLQDEAVKSRLLGIDTIQGQAYQEIEVRFKAESGGQDFEDVYVYWFHTQDKTLDYLAYSFEVNEGGTRFRVAKNRRSLPGLYFRIMIIMKGTKTPPWPTWMLYGRRRSSKNFLKLSILIIKNCLATRPDWAWPPRLLPAILLPGEGRDTNHGDATIDGNSDIGYLSK
ncbi:MAG: hypothetical protein HC913_11265 [Microscillaceae bacterium]|nr:hypothetical protein [Microscillaceae bacterium]